MAQQFYISGGEALIGPVSPRDLRQMAIDGSIQPDTQISLDGRKWIQASAIKELVFGPPVESDSGPSLADRFKSTVKKTANALGDVISGITSAAQSTSAMIPTVNELPPPQETKPPIIQAGSVPQDRSDDAWVIPKVRQLLTAGEEIVFTAAQKKPIVNITPDCIVLTTKRFMFFKVKLLGQISFEDRVWRELRDAKIAEGILGATFSIQSADGKLFSLDYIPKVQARQLYRFAQDMEERSAEERRQRQLEEKRAGSGGIAFGGVPGFQQPQQVATEHPLQKLTNLKQMLDAGLITAQEYESKKAEILSRM